jgi:2-oxoisovalerate dehydrogenase E1 component beta subunit
MGTPIPMTVRLPCGGGFSGGPFHSQMYDGYFAHCPGLKVVLPATPEDAKGMMIEAIRDPNPVLFFEHKNLYRRIKGEVPEGNYTVPFGKARIAREGADITIVAWSAMVHTAMDAAEQLAGEGIDCEVLDMRTIVPLDFDAIAASVTKTGKALVLSEDTKTGGFAGEISARIAEELFETLDAPVRRIASADCPIPFAPGLEKAVLPQVDGVAAAVRELSAY